MTKNNTILRTFLMAVTALCVFAAATVFGISVFEEWIGIIIGVIMMVAAIPLHRFGKKQNLLYFLSFLFNSVGCGFSASAYYITQKINAELGELFAAALIAIILLFACAAVLFFTSKMFTEVSVVFLILDSLVAAFAVAGWVTEGDAFFSFLFFSCLVAFFYIFAMKKAAKEYETCEIMRTISFHSFGIFILVTVIVILILSEGDGLDGFDLGDTGSGKSKKKNKSTANALALGALEVADDALGSVGLSDYASAKEDENDEEKFRKENPKYFE